MAPNIHNINLPPLAPKESKIINNTSLREVLLHTRNRMEIKLQHLVGQRVFPLNNVERRRPLPNGRSLKPAVLDVLLTDGFPQVVQVGADEQVVVGGGADRDAGVVADGVALTVWRTK
jgi:hypothetical protein